MKHAFALALLVVCAVSARAQLAVYGMGSAGRISSFNSLYATSPSAPALNTAGNFWAYGGTIGVYDNFLTLGPVQLGADIRGFIQSSSNAHNTYGNQLRGAFIGPRLALHIPLIPFRPYVQAEFGGISTNYGQNSSRTGNFAYQVQLGSDFTVFPHLDLRAEYGFGQTLTAIGSTPVHLQQFGIGAVIRF